MEPTDQLAHVLPALSTLVAGIDPAQLDDPTPCDHFAVRDVLDHMIVLGGTFSYLFRGEEPPTIVAPPPNGTVPSAPFQTTMTDLLDAVRSEGALERTIVSPVGTMPGSDFARLVAFDGLVHGWDLATATGLPYEPPEPVVAAVDDFARAAITADLRDGDTFKDATIPAEGASRLERLAAFSGRTIRTPSPATSPTPSPITPKG
jgi:uncharacterized protein (TIGR03086 family)